MAEQFDLDLDELERLLAEATPEIWTKHWLEIVLTQAHSAQIPWSDLNDPAHHYRLTERDVPLIVALRNAALELIRLARERMADREYVNGRVAELERRLAAQAPSALPDKADM